MKSTEGEELKEDRNVFKLLSQLRREKLFITNEKLNIQKLIKTIEKKTENVSKLTWIATKQRLYLLNQRDFTTLNYEHIRGLENCKFVEGKKVVGFQNSVKIENLLKILRAQPEQLAQWLLLGEHLSLDLNGLLQTLVTNLYASCIFPEDVNAILKLLHEIAKLQLLKCDQNPCDILKHSSIKNLYFIFTEVLTSAKLFLNAALELPILRLLSYKELYLDIDPQRSLLRFKQSDLRNEFRDIQEYRNEVVRKLVEFTNFFICSLRENVYSFPKPIAWIVYHISKIITQKFGIKESNVVVTELIFTLYICPAIVDPERYCICDLQISDITQHNLMQIAQILQALSLNKFETLDTKFCDIYNLLDADILANFLEDILFSLEYDDDLPAIDVTPQVTRDCALFSEDELHNLIMFFQRVHNEQNDGVKKNDINLIEEHVAALILPPSLENSPKTHRPYTNGFGDGTVKRSNFLSLVTKKPREENHCTPPTTVLIFSLEKEAAEPIGLLSEEKVLNMNQNVKKDNIDKQTSTNRNEEKNFLDEGSIGNTSDNLEAISEAASNHSVPSSLEMENEDQNDNLSDMISANVSGRGTPNISGRDTPSSQVNDIEERPRQVDVAPPPPQISRQIRSEIDDKFCKFEIKKLLEEDETISIISETWSTDVLASDNETVDTETRQVVEVPTALDMSETQSESAWSTDVVASDTERADVDNDDTGSVAQSDETRSEIDENLSTTRQSCNLFQEKNDIKTDNNANNLVFKSATKDTPGPSGFNFDDSANEILLSNLSLNSSSSGSSSNSFEIKQCWENKQWLNSSGSSLNITSTPSESTSELSVLSVSNNPILNNKKPSTRNIKPSASTGAIPKSISFDISADKGDDERSKRGSFFGKLRMGFKTRRGKSFRDDFNTNKMEDKMNEAVGNTEASDDILAKYRKPFMENSPLKNNTEKSLKIKPLRDNDVNNSFDDIKKKLRLVLSLTVSPIPKVIKENRLSVKSKLETILRLELGKARKLKEWSNIARISETLRFVNVLNESTCLNLIQSLHEDFIQRSVYTEYLVYSRQDLLFCQSYLEGLNEQILNEKQQCEKYLSIVCVRKFLLEQEDRILQFCEEFKEITLSDEKYDFLNNFYQQLYSIMQNGLWRDIFKNQCDTIKITLERCIMSKIYKNALYPNGDGDRHRDRLLHQHIEKLSNIISPEHKDLMIHKMFLRELPWIPAQDALKAMNAYKTPRDKINCVVHCAKCIMDLLSFSQNSGSTTADDFTPVLVYVIIRVNPSDLLSTIQFVNSFYQNQIGGEELYWWTQFSSAVEYIKTMDYSD